MKDQRSMPGGILGIIGSVFCLIGGMVLTACTCAVDVLAGLVGLGGSGEAVGETSEIVILQQAMIIVSVLCWLGAIAGLIGAIMDFKKPIVGGSVLAGALVLQIIALVIRFDVVVSIAVASYIGFVLYIPAVITSFLVRKDIVKVEKGADAENKDSTEAKNGPQDQPPPPQGPQGPYNGPQGPYNGPQGPYNGPQGPYNGPQDPSQGQNS